MKLAPCTAILVAALAASSPAVAQQAAAPAAAAGQPKITISRQAAKAIDELRKAVDAKDVANIPAKLAAAQAAAATPQDRYAIAQFQLKAAVAANNYAQAAAAIDAMAATGIVAGSQMAGTYRALASNMYNAKDYAGAAKQLERAVILEPNNPETLELLAEAQFAQGQGSTAATTLIKALQLSTSAGRKPEENVYKRAVSIAYESKAPGAVELGRQWVTAYPSKDSWKNSIAIYRNLNHPDVGPTLDLLRLLRTVGALDSAREYGLYASAAADVGQYNEAQDVLKEGLTNKMATPSDPLVRELTSGLRAKQKATAADLASATKMATTPAALIRIGDGYYGLGDYAKAAETYRAALGKGADANLANLHLGMALVRSGDRAGGITALEKVGGAQSDIAKYWLIYARQKG